MNVTIQPGKLNGTIHAIPSKSHAHRLLICAAFSDKETTLYCPETNQDIEATADCLRALGARIQRTSEGYCVTPAVCFPSSAVLNCRESGSTLRFMLPIAGALGIHTTFQMGGRLPKRPLSPLWEELERMGCVLSRPTADTILCTGRLRPGQYAINGSVSSQYVTGLLFAMALMQGVSKLEVIGKLESLPYVELTQAVLFDFGIDTTNYCVHGQFPFRSPALVKVDGDWSNGAFFLAANKLGSSVSVEGLNLLSPQGDRAVVDILDNMDAFSTVSAANIPDLVPILSVVAAAKSGCIFTEVGRLRLKESDRVASVIGMLHSLGIHAEATDNTLTIYPGNIRSGIVDSVNDHRIAMAAAIAATAADGPVTIIGAECVAKSYPSFWKEYEWLGGNYEQYIR